MKPNIHPQYVEAKVTCACGNSWTTRSTRPNIHVDLCSNCHPFYTGEQRIVDTAGRVDLFKRRLEKRQERAPKQRQAAQQEQQTLSDLAEQLPAEEPAPAEQ